MTKISQVVRVPAANLKQGLPQMSRELKESVPLGTNYESNILVKGVTRKSVDTPDTDAKVIENNIPPDVYANMDSRTLESILNSSDINATHAVYYDAAVLLALMKDSGINNVMEDVILEIMNVTVSPVVVLHVGSPDS